MIIESFIKEPTHPAWVVTIVKSKHVLAFNCAHDYCHISDKIITLYPDQEILEVFKKRK